MTNVIVFRKPDPSSNSVADFIAWLELLQVRATQARNKIEGARSLDKVLSYYADWLRRYYEMNGAVRSLWDHLERDIRVHGREIDVDRADEIVDLMAEIEGGAKSPSPWTALPSFSRTQGRAVGILNSTLDNLTWAIGKAKAIGRPVPTPPDERKSA